ncbi:MAG: CHRD domain-containing protein [Pyrinomonadaceae bacterium]
MNGLTHRKVSTNGYWRLAAVALAFALAVGVPFFFGERSSSAQTSTAGTFLVAPLTGAPIGGVTPGGRGSYYSDTFGRSLEVSVGNVNLPAATVLDVTVDGTAVGTIRLTTYHNGVLRLSTRMGQTVPNINAGAALAVKSGSTTILSGSFILPPTPSPTATRTPYPTPSAAFFAPLSGPTIDGIMPRGVGQYAEFGTANRVLNVFVDRVHLPAGTQLSVMVGDAAVGTITLDSDGDGGLRKSTANGDTVPTVTAGTMLSVKNGSTTVLSGTFQVPPPPSPTPTISPTPNPSPRPNRFFGGWLNGRQVVPAVQTEARGVVFVALNAAETEVTVNLGFVRLSSEQSTAKIYGPAMPGETGPVIFTIDPIGGTMGRFPAATFPVTAEQVAQLRSGLWYVQIGSVNHPDGEIRGQIRGRSRPSGFSGADIDDVAVYRPSDGSWYLKTDSGYAVQPIGQPGDVPVTGDFDADGKTDSAVYRDGTWLIRRSSDGGLTTRQWGLPGDIPLRGDFDGDGTADIAVFRPSNGVWYIQRSNGTGNTIVQFGMNGDVPVVSDLDGDGRADISVYRGSTGVWYWLESKTGAFRAVQFGVSGDVPIVGDFDGDGAGDVSVYRPSTGVWYTLRSIDGGVDIRQFGLSSDIPVAGNFDSDTITDLAVFRPSTGIWYILRSSDGTVDYRYFGASGDIPALR